jgi:hypothetical protein
MQTRVLAQVIGYSVMVSADAVAQSSSAESMNNFTTFSFGERR